ncbi:formin-binding protein HOF1 [Paracoccidioides brasiliensis Pb18]|uniref:SH3 domain-containing protein n=1 Tax=Paracoccidioides brasiliensis (strain Pb18) TaxID=502780 RepID=C1G127_PARBD|nr:formin-binding protein HOF1 [Paracoccidioides brasiliensis Pb18]EEH44278.2 hypothetical protein PADG_00567 [Paracoccidioides brasiliensis Pb18]
MPGPVSETPSVALSFANNFWGKDDAGVGPMLERVHNAKLTCDELKAFYNTRAAIEDEYARKLLVLSRKALGSAESGSLRASLDTVRGETEAIGKTHAAIAAQMKSELEEPLAAFSGGMKERRKIVQNGIEKLLKTKIQQTQAVNKSRDRYEQDCLRIKGYLAQGHMVMGQEERKNKAKLEKAQIQLAANSSEYESAVKILEETTGRWNKEWKAACDKFQDLEEERLDFTKSSLWNYANIASTACVSDDASCERIRVSLESCEVEKDISSFIIERGTGQEIPDPPKYINFCRGDLNNTSSDTSEEEGYSVAQFQRAINPAYRSSSPAPSTYESHHDPQSELAMRMGGHAADPPTPASRETNVTPQRPQPSQVQQQQPQQPQHPPPQQPQQSQQHLQQQPQTQLPPPDIRRGVNIPPNYQPSQHGDIRNVPHNEYPTDGMTMFCRTGPPSERSSGTSGNRPSSRGSHSDISNPTSFSSMEPSSGRQSPKKTGNDTPLPGRVADKQVQKKKSTFFSNSPFRRKSKHDKENPNATVVKTPTSRNTWTAPPKQTSPVKSPYEKPTYVSDLPSGSPEPVDPRANFQLNVGNNVFDVASPDAAPKAGANANKDGNDLDPIAQALADLKGVGKQASVRVSADRYHGITTPVPPSVASSQMGDGNIAAAQRGTPPPAYNDPSMKRLGAPQPAFTSAQMQETTRKYVGQTQEMFNNNNNHTRTSQAEIRVNTAIPRPTSTAPRRSLSPQPSSRGDSRQQYDNSRNNPSPSSYYSHSGSMSSRYHQSPSATPTKAATSHSYSPQQYSHHGSPNDQIQRAISPQPQFRRQDRPSSASGMELQLSSNQIDPQGGGYKSDFGSQGGRRSNARPMSTYYGSAPDVSQGGRVRSRSVATTDGNRHLSLDGRPVLHYARAMYSYNAAIPEELGFAKGDILAVLRHQDDGWWEAEVTSPQRSHPGLVPSNYLQNC